MPKAGSKVWPTLYWPFPYCPVASGEKADGILWMGSVHPKMLTLDIRLGQIIIPTLWSLEAETGR